MLREQFFVFAPIKNDKTILIKIQKNTKNTGQQKKTTRQKTFRKIETTSVENLSITNINQ